MANNQNYYTSENIQILEGLRSKRQGCISDQPRDGLKSSRLGNYR